MRSLFRLAVAALLAVSTVTTGVSVRCLMADGSEHACCGEATQARIASPIECPLVAPAAPSLERGDSSRVDVTIALALAPAPIAAAIVPAADIALVDAVSAPPACDSPPGGLVLRI